jgi:hypothetical protein
MRSRAGVCWLSSRQSGFVEEDGGTTSRRSCEVVCLTKSSPDHTGESIYVAHMWSKAAFQAAQIEWVAKSSIEICRRGEDVATPSMSEIPRILGAQRRRQKLELIVTSDSKVKNVRIQPRRLL